MAVALVLALTASGSVAQERAPEELLGRWPSAAGGTLDDVRIAAGIREALHAASEAASRLAGAHDGYNGNPAIRIALPERLNSVARGARAVGQGHDVDRFVRSMNRAAERAVPSARAILREAIDGVPLDEPRRVLDAGATGATDVLRAHASGRAPDALRPAVAAALHDTGAAEQYRELFGRVQALPFMHGEPFDLERYVTERTLDGLFHLMGEHERRIRLEPTARTSEVLRDVFGSRREQGE